MRGAGPGCGGLPQVDLPQALDRGHAGTCLRTPPYEAGPPVRGHAGKKLGRGDLAQVVDRATACVQERSLSAQSLVTQGSPDRLHTAERLRFGNYLLAKSPNGSY